MQQLGLVAQRYGARVWVRYTLRMVWHGSREARGDNQLSGKRGTP